MDPVATTNAGAVVVEFDYVERAARPSNITAPTASVDKCDYCKDEEIYDDPALLKQHIRQNHRYKCVKCFVDFANAHLRYEHLINCEKFMLRRRVCDFCENIIYDNPAAEERHNKTQQHQKFARIFERGFDEGMSKLMKNLLHSGYDMERCYASEMSRRDSRRRLKKRRQEEKERVYVNIEESNLSADSYQLLASVEGVTGDAAAPVPLALTSGKVDVRNQEAPVTENDAVPNAINAEPQETANDPPPPQAEAEKQNVSSELDSLSRAVTGEDDPAPGNSDSVLPDFEDMAGAGIEDSLMSNLLGGL